MIQFPISISRLNLKTSNVLSRLNIQQDFILLVLSTNRQDSFLPLQNTKQIHIYMYRSDQACDLIVATMIINSFTCMAKDKCNTAKRGRKGQWKKVRAQNNFKILPKKSSPCTSVFFIRISWVRGWHISLT